MHVSLTLSEARARADLVGDVHTSAHFDLTSTDQFTVRATVRFSAAAPGAATFLELADASDVRIEGAPGATYSSGRILMPRVEATNTVTVTASLPYVTDGDGMHVAVDPVDGERYVSAFTAMDIAQKVLPCFDQPDLKSTFEVSVSAPSHWSVLANGRFAERTGDTWRFHRTPPISSYVFFVCGGPWTSITWDEPYAPAPGGSLPFGWHARSSQRALLERDAEHLRRITSACFAHYTAVFDEPYPFADYQQVFSPGLNWGAMEFPGCVAFRDEMLTPDQPTAMQDHWRSSVIAHEMAHMWFGDLVTFRWWEDSWLNESFADFMGYEVAGLATGSDAWTAAALSRKPTAYRADRKRSTHPVAEDAAHVIDVDTAFANFDMITYAKGNALLRQLVVWLGEEAFLAGVNRHLSAHPFGNATLGDFVAALDQVTARDVRGWADTYLRTTGFDRIEVVREGEVPVLTPHGSRPHRFTVAAFDSDLAQVDELLVDVTGEPLRLDRFAGRVVLPNAGDEAYAEVALDASSWDALTGGVGRLASARHRAVVWAMTALRAESGGMSPAALVEMASNHLPHECDPTVFEGALDLVERVALRYASDVEAPVLADVFASLGRAVLAAGDPERRGAASRLLATHTHDVDLLRGWLGGTSPLPEADQTVRWAVVVRLAALGHPGHIDTETQRDPSRRGVEAAITARAAEDTTAAKEAAWARLTSGSASNREVTALAAGLWQPEQADLLEPWLLAAPAALVDLARRSGQGMGSVLGRSFPWLPLRPAVRSELRARLAAALNEPEVPVVIGRALSDHLDDLDLVLAADLGAPR